MDKMQMFIDLRQAADEIRTLLRNRFPDVYLADFELWHRAGNQYQSALLQAGREHDAELSDDELIDRFVAAHKKEKNEAFAKVVAERMEPQ